MAHAKVENAVQPAERWILAKQRRAGIDYHVEINRHYDSVPHQLIKQKLWVRVTARTVEIFHKG